MADQIGFEQAVIDGILQDLDPLSEALGQSMGMPPGAQKYSDREIDELWNASPIADPEQRAQQMMAMYQQGIASGADPKALVEQITDQVYPKRRQVIETSHAKPDDQIKFAKQQERRMARQARDLGHHIANVEPWATITQDNAPDPNASPGPVGGSSAPAAGLGSPASAGAENPAGAPTPPTVPGWAQPGGNLGLTGMQPQ